MNLDQALARCRRSLQAYGLRALNGDRADAHAALIELAQGFELLDEIMSKPGPLALPEDWQKSTLTHSDVGLLRQAINLAERMGWSCPGPQRPTAARIHRLIDTVNQLGPKPTNPKAADAAGKDTP